jgi:ParB family transcriptional regulator, chromosome partitioning protein
MAEFVEASSLIEIDPRSIEKNPNNPRRYFNDESLDILRTSIQEVGILVPLIVYEDPESHGRFVLMDGERRWRCALDLGLESLPANKIEPPSDLENLLRMFNIHSVREEWPLISVAFSLREVIAISGEDRESRLAEMTGLTRSTVRRAKRLLTIPELELELIQREAHLDRAQQVHREDLYLEIETAESVIRSELPEIASEYPREQIIRSFAEKREQGTLRAVTEFRDVGRLIKAVDDDLVSRETVTEAVRTLIEDVEATPEGVFQGLAQRAYEQQGAARKADLLSQTLSELNPEGELSETLRDALAQLQSVIAELLERGE